MSDGWEQATAAETWALVEGDGWMTREALDERDVLAAEVRALQARRDALSHELAARVRAAESSGRQQGLEAAQADIDAAVASLRADRLALADAAVSAALEVAAVLVREAVAGDSAAARALIDRTLAAARDQAATALRVHPALVPLATRSVDAAIRVEGDPSCGPADVIVETERGRVDGRIATWCALFEPEVRASVLAAAEVADDE